MTDNIIVTVSCQIDLEPKLISHQLELDFAYGDAANDPLFMDNSQQHQGYTSDQIAQILNITTAKQVERIAVKLKLTSLEYRHLNSYGQFIYHQKSIDKIALYLKYNVA